MFGAEYSDYLTLLRKSNQIIGCLSSIRDNRFCSIEDRQVPLLRSKQEPRSLFLPIPSLLAGFFPQQ